MTARLEAIDSRHPETVALLTGPMVLFAVADSQSNPEPNSQLDSQAIITRAQLLAAKRMGAQAWQVESAGGAIKMLPFPAIGDEEYSTYLRVG